MNQKLYGWGLAICFQVILMQAKSMETLLLGAPGSVGDIRTHLIELLAKIQDSQLKFNFRLTRFLLQILHQIFLY